MGKCEALLRHGARQRDQSGARHCRSVHVPGACKPRTSACCGAQVGVGDERESGGRAHGGADQEQQGERSRRAADADEHRPGPGPVQRSCGARDLCASLPEQSDWARQPPPPALCGRRPERPRLCHWVSSPPISYNFMIYETHVAILLAIQFLQDGVRV